MSGEEASSSGAGSGSGGAAIQYDYNSNISKHERSANHNKPPMFNGDPEMFSWWKTKMYMLEQGCFTSHLLSFENNKVLKIINWIC